MNKKLFGFAGIILLNLLSTSFSSFAGVICPSVDELNKTIGNGTGSVEVPIIGIMRVQPPTVNDFKDIVLVAWVETSVFSGFLTCAYKAPNKRPGGIVRLTATQNRSWKDGRFFPWYLGSCRPPNGSIETCVTG